jgi:hypothetical protein
MHVIWQLRHTIETAIIRERFRHKLDHVFIFLRHMVAVSFDLLDWATLL